MRFVAKFVAVTFALLLASTANAANFYVSLSGNDANAGSLAAPFRTITKASTAARAGDVVNVRGGVYNEVVKIGARGTASARITFQSYANERAVIDGTGTATGTNLVQITGGYVDFVGFEVRNATRVGILGYGASNIRIARNVVHGNYRGGILVQAPTGSVATDIDVEGNTVYNNCLENVSHASPSGWGQGLSLFRTDRTRVVGNKVYKNYGEGIDFILSDNGVATGNEVFDNYSINMYVDNGQAITLTGNLIYTTRDVNFFRNNQPAHSIGLANETYEIANVLDGVTISDNVVIGGLSGVYYYAHSAQMKNVMISNNTFYSAPWAMVNLSTVSHANVVVQNNIFFQTNGGSMALAFGSGVVFRNNNWYGGNAGAAAGSGDVLANPRLTNPGGLSAADYKLQAGSPLIEKGLPFSSSDFFGNKRSDGIDIGAHEFSLFHTEMPGQQQDAQAPTRPESVRAAHVDATTVTLAWSPATDNVAVTAYEIYRDGSSVAKVQETSWVDNQVMPSTTYHYEVIALDAAGNKSVGSDIVRVVSQPSNPSADTSAPTLPANVHATAVTNASVTLAWTASRDNVTVAAYEISRNGAVIATVNDTTFTDVQVAASTSYSYAVVALDAAGNRSAAGAVQVTTKAPQRRR